MIFHASFQNCIPWACSPNPCPSFRHVSLRLLGINHMVAQFPRALRLLHPSWLHQSDHASILRQVEHINKCCVILECSGNQSLQLADLRRVRNQMVHENEMMQAIRRGILQAGVGVRYSTSWRLVGFRLLDMHMQRCDGCFTGQSTPSAAADVSMWLLIIMLLE